MSTHPPGYTKYYDRPTCEFCNHCKTRTEQGDKTEYILECHHGKEPVQVDMDDVCDMYSSKPHATIPENE